MRQATSALSDRNSSKQRSRVLTIFSSTAAFGLLSLFPKALAVFKDMAVAARFGTSHALDAYFMAFVLIGFPVAVLVVAVQTTLIPALVTRERSEAAALLGSVFRLMLPVLVVILPVWLFFIPKTYALFFSSRSSGESGPLLHACILLIPYYFTNGINILMYGALQARKVFWSNALLPGLFPLAILSAFALLPEQDIRVLILGTCFGSALETCALFFLLKKAGLIHFQKVLHEESRRVFRLALPLMFGGVLSSLAPIVEQGIAYSLGVGAVSLLNYGNKIPAAINSLLLTAVGIVVLPHFAELASRGQWFDCRHLMVRLSGLASVVGLAVTAAGVFFSSAAIRLLFERGAFTPADTVLTATIMESYVLQVPFLLVGMIAVRLLAALGKTGVMTAVLLVQLCVGGSLAYLLSRFLGVSGIALGGTLGVAAGSLLCFAFALRFISSRVRGGPS